MKGISSVCAIIASVLSALVLANELIYYFAHPHSSGLALTIATLAAAVFFLSASHLLSGNIKVA